MRFGTDRAAARSPARVVPPNALERVFEHADRSDWAAIRATCADWRDVFDAWCPRLRPRAPARSPDAWRRFVRLQMLDLRACVPTASHRDAWPGTVHAVAAPADAVHALPPRTTSLICTPPRRPCVAALHSLPRSLTQLSLARCGAACFAVTDGAYRLVGLERLTRLTSLDLAGNFVSKRGDTPLELTSIARLPALTALSLAHNLNLDLSALGAARGLTRLDLTGVATVNKHGLRALADLRGLTDLRLSHTVYTGAYTGLCTLTRFERLRRLSLPILRSGSHEDMATVLNALAA